MNATNAALHNQNRLSIWNRSLCQIPTRVHIYQWNWHKCSVKSHKEDTPSDTTQKNMKLPSLSDTSAATVSWKTGQHKTSASNLNINLKHDIWNLLHGNSRLFYEKEKKQKWSRNKQATRAQPTFLERHSNTQQMLAISTSALNLTY